MPKRTGRSANRSPASNVVFSQMGILAFLLATGRTTSESPQSSYPIATALSDHTQAGDERRTSSVEYKESTRKVILGRAPRARCENVSFDCRAHDVLDVDAVGSAALRNSRISSREPRRLKANDPST